ncbi:hypothetical protein CBR_g27989 [Chara braunii]|uniref:DUF659 domain-containing protein n=1 Tax=Chara braunii TaxID=69332 RepID=A0A388L8Y9_CHABU|nr:hypothetical protein CBR_g27989 [Chara braunii]|eukprot:GBG78765.1 hypothetical protein CBR_g27989 [Chara braunii]
MYDKEKLAEFHDSWVQWIYAKGLTFNAFRGPEFQTVRRAAERVPRTVHFRFPSYRVTAGTGIPSERGKVALMVSEVRSAFRHTGATILSDGRKSRSGKPLVNFLAGGADDALLYATVARDGSVRDTADIDALESMLHDDAWARIPWERKLVSQAHWVQQQIRDDEFWRCVDCAIRVMSPIHQLLRRMDRGGMMMSIVYEWSQHLLELMRRVDVSADMVEPCAETAGGQEDDEEDVDPKVRLARPAGSFSEHDIEHQVVAFHACRPSRADPVQDVFGKRAVELRSWPEQTSDADVDGDTSDDE